MKLTIFSKERQDFFTEVQKVKNDLLSENPSLTEGKAMAEALKIVKANV